MCFRPAEVSQPPVKCPNCGGEVFYSNGVLPNSCPFCREPLEGAGNGAPAAPAAPGAPTKPSGIPGIPSAPGAATKPSGIPAIPAAPGGPKTGN